MQVKNNDSEVIKETKKKPAIFELKYFKRSITFSILIFLLAIYLFIGVIATEWNNLINISIASYFFSLLTLFILLLGCYEILKLYQATEWKWYTKGYYFLIVIIFYFFPFQSPFGDNSYLNFPFYSQINLKWDYVWVRVLVALGLILAFMALLFAKKSNFSQIIKILLFSAYLAISLKALEEFMLSSNLGWSSVVWIFLVVICTDTFAFLGGVLYGKNKLAPTISPNKTIEGVVTGVTIAAFFGSLYAGLMYHYQSSNHWVFIISNNWSTSPWHYVMYVLLSIVASFLAVLGDLIFSAIKRINKIKDFGTIFPGHGGVLDRLDSLTLVLFIMWFITLFS